MNLRQRRGVLFLTGSVLSVFVGGSSLAGYVRDVNEQVGPMVDVAMLDRDVAAYTPLTDDDITIVEVPRRWAPDHALTSSIDVLGLVAGTDLRAGTYLTEGILVASPELSPGEREIAILIDAETGVAGKVESGSRVDIVATFTDPATGQNRAEVIVAHARVLDVGDLQADADDEDADDEGSFERGRVVPVTFALSVEEALILTYAESFAEQVRLALIGANDDASVPPEDRSFELDEELGDDEGEQ